MIDISNIIRKAFAWQNKDGLGFLEPNIKEASEHSEKIVSNLCNALCGVLDQSYSCMSEEDKGEYRTTYNYDAIAVDLLEKHGYVEIIDGKWPQTKYLTFKFTKKRTV